jgi:outer membrane protein assembly factor BamD
MRNTLVWFLFLVIFISSCKSEFERVRTSSDAELILNKAFEYYEKEKYQRAQTLFDLVLTTVRGDARAEKAYFQYAYTHYHQKQFLLAAYYFKNFSNTFLNSPYREEAAFMSAYSNYLLSPVLSPGTRQYANRY